MTAKKKQTTAAPVDINFALAGIDISQAFSRQMPRPLPNGVYARTTPIGINVQGYEPLTDRARGGSRPMLKRYISTQPGGSSGLIQELNSIVTITTPGSVSDPGGVGAVQSTQSGRVVKLVAIQGGNGYAVNAGDSAWTPIGNASATTIPLNATGLIRSAALNQKLYFVDGVRGRRYDPSTNQIGDWSVSAGSFPVDSAGNYPTLIVLWRGRIVLSGLLLDPQNWFMSKVYDATDWNYSPTSITPTQAVAGNNSSLGLIGDIVTCLIPFSDDYLIIGGDSTIWMMAGDPMAGGQILRVSDAIGMAFGSPWCKDPYGTVYFVSNRMGVYSMAPGQQPQRISQSIEKLLLDVDTGARSIRLLWDDRAQGLRLFVTTAAGATLADSHFLYEARSGAWWQIKFGNANHNPLCCCTFDGNLPGDRVGLIGSWDGYVRYFDTAVSDNALATVRDDGTVCASEIWLGPLTSPTLDEMLLQQLQAELGLYSGDVEYAVYVGRTAEEAMASDPVDSGVWSLGRNPTTPVRASGYAVFVRLTASNPWQFERIRAMGRGLGKVRQRGAG